MPILPRRFQKLKAVLNSRMADLTILTENVEKPHNLSAILRTCDAVGILQAHTISSKNKPSTFNSTAQGSQKWVRLKTHSNIQDATHSLKSIGFKLYGTNLEGKSCDYRECDFTGPSAFVLGSEKWGLSSEANALMDQSIYIPMRGMVQSLNVSVAAATLIFEALRQREVAGIVPTKGDGLSKELFAQTIFEWAYPEVAEWCKSEKRSYPKLNESGEIVEKLPRTVKIKC